MPQAETQPMQRPGFIRVCHAGTDSFSALCHLFGISRKTGYKWPERFVPSDPEHSRAPTPYCAKARQENLTHTRRVF